jgi:hypothetical protein
MERVGAETTGIHEFLVRVRGAELIGVALTQAPVPDTPRWSSCGTRRRSST